MTFSVTAPDRLVAYPNRAVTKPPFCCGILLNTWLIVGKYLEMSGGIAADNSKNWAS